MREIKFRAWDKESKTMAFVGAMDWAKENDSYPITVNTLERKLYRCDPDDFVLMQFTGLKDKNGKEIYEGDVVTCESYPFKCDGEPNYNGTIEWIYSQWQIVLHSVSSKNRGGSDGLNSGLNDDGLEEGGRTDLEVIGNIYENPELLK